MQGQVATTCGQCLAGCGIRVDAARRVTGDPDDPVTQGYVCANGRAAIDVVGHPGRLTRPLRRGQAVPWSEAFDAAVAGIRRARDIGGPDAIGLYFGAGDPAGSLAFLAAAGFLQGLGSRRHYNVIGLEATHRYVVAEAMFGSPLAVPRPDLERAGGALIVGTNPLVSNDEGGIVAALDRLHRRKAVTVVLDPRRTELARRATVHLAVRPGTDADVILSMLHVILSSGRATPSVTEETDGLERLRKLAARMPPERAAELAGVSAADIDRAARLLARAAPVTVLSRLGTAMGRRGTVTEWLGWALVGCLGGLGRAGGLVLNPGFLDLGAMMARAPRAEGSIVGVLSPADLADHILEGGPGRPRVLVVVAADLLASVPNTAKLERALRTLDELIVLDVMPTPTTALATLVLPCAHHLEKDDVALLLPDRQPLRYARASRPVAPPPSGARSEVAIFGELARRLGTPVFGARALDGVVRLASRWYPEPHAPGAMSPRAAMQVVVPLLSRFELRGRRLSRGHLAGADGVPSGRALHDAVTRAGGRIDLAPPRLVAELERTLDVEPAAPVVRGSGERVLWLSTCNRSRDFINSKLALVGRAAGSPVLHLHPDDAAALSLADGERALLETDAGELEALAHHDPSQRPGAAGMYFGTPGINRLTSDRDLDPLSRIAAVANVPCRVTRLAPVAASPLGSSEPPGVPA